MPRIKDLADQGLFKLDRDRHYGELRLPVRSDGQPRVGRRAMGPDGAPGGGAGAGADLRGRITVHFTQEGEMRASQNGFIHWFHDVYKALT